jgi:hypothetical protein
MKSSMMAKLVLASGLTVAFLGASVVPMAQADPLADGRKSSYGVLTGVGSDTLQDIDNGLQAAIGRVTTNGNWKLASYDATSDSDHETLVTKDGGATFYRPNGSGAGANVLLTAIGALGSATGKTFATPGTTRTWTAAGAVGDDNMVVGQVQYSRSSGGPSTNARAAGVVSYVPFARDAVDYAVAATTHLPQLTVGAATDAADGNHIVPSTLYAIYKCVATKVVVGGANDGKLVDNSYSAGAGETLETIHPYVPQLASGTREFWLTQFYGNKTYDIATNVPCVKDHYNSGANSVQEHDGSALVDDPDAIMPFSIPKWVGMAKNAASIDGFSNLTDSRNGAVLGHLEGLTPTSGSGATLALNADFVNSTLVAKVVRLIYHVVPYRELTTQGTPEYAMFNGRSSLVCSQTSTITAFGFGALTDTSGASSCGYTETRAFDASTPTVTMGTATHDDSALTATFPVTTFTSNGTGGAKLYVVATDSSDATNHYIVNSKAPGTIAAGATSGSVTIDYADLKLGTEWNLSVTVVPNLSGVANFDSSTLWTKSRAASAVTAVASGKVKKAGKLVVTVLGNGDATPTGSVTVYQGTNAAGTVVGTVNLVAGKATLTLAKQNAKGTVRFFTVYSGDATYTGSNVKSSWVVK